MYARRALASVAARCGRGVPLRTFSAMRSSVSIEDRAQIKVLNAVRRALVKTPELGNRELYDRAVARYAWVEGLSRKQFYGRFVRRARRKVGVKPQRSRSTAVTQPHREKPKAPAPAEAKRPGNTGRSPRPRTDHAPKPQVAPRHEVRRLFVEFAKHVAAAESDSEIIEAFRRVDGFADRVLRACRSI